MQKRSLSAANAPQPKGGYSTGPPSFRPESVGRFVSGQIPQTVDGTVPADFTAQAKLVWANVESQLKAVDMTLTNIVKVTTFLSDRKYNIENRSRSRRSAARPCAGADRDHCRNFRRSLAAGDRGGRGGLNSVIHPHQIDERTRRCPSWES